MAEWAEAKDSPPGTCYYVHLGGEIAMVEASSTGSWALLWSPMTRLRRQGQRMLSIQLQATTADAAKAEALGLVREWCESVLGAIGETT